MSEPSGPIQTIPRGLLGLLQLKTRGQMPDVLQGNVQPTVEMLELWLNSGAQLDGVLHAVALGTGASGPAVYSPNPIVVPQNETWFVHYYTVRCILPVGAAERVDYFAPAMFLQRLGTALWHTLIDLPIVVVGNAASNSGAAVTARGFWAPPGAELGFFVGDVTTGTNVTFDGQVYATRMQT